MEESKANFFGIFFYLASPTKSKLPALFCLDFTKLTKLFLQKKENNYLQPFWKIVIFSWWNPAWSSLENVEFFHIVGKAWDNLVDKNIISVG